MICLLVPKRRSEACDITTCDRCGWNKRVDEKRRDQLRSMNRKELSEMFLAWAEGRAWK